MAIMMNPQQANSVPPMRPPSGAVNQPQSPPGQPQQPQGNPLKQLLAQLMQAISALVQALQGSQAPDEIKQEGASLLQHFQKFAAMLSGGPQPDSGMKTTVNVGTQGTRVTTPEQGGRPSTPAL